MIHADIAIVGAGMAGASLAAELAPHASVALIEAESRPGYHATGRSAAFWAESYGGPAIQPLTSASRDLLADPADDFAERGFLRPRGALHLAPARDEGAVDRFQAAFAGTGVVLRSLDARAAGEMVPGLRAGWRGVLEPSTADIDVAALHAAYLRAARRAGARLLCDAPLRAAERRDGGWRIAAGSQAVRAAVIVDAAGAWADTVAERCGARALSITPYRRTIAQLRLAPPPPDAMPLVIDLGGRFYFKPETGGRLWLSPHDETPVMPGDAAAEEIDVALAIERMTGVVEWRVEAVERRWAGLRSFAPDRLPVYGFDGRVPGFFWFAGQGGFGIQTAPAAARLAAGLVLGRAPHPGVAHLDPERYAATRFAS